MKNKTVCAIITGWRYLVYQFWYRDTAAVQFLIGLAGIFWSVMLFWPGDTFERQTYFYMAEFMSEHAWAWFFGIHGVVMIILSSRVVQFSFWFDVIFMTIGCVLWTGSCIAMLLSVYPPPAAIAAEIALAFGAWWILVRTEYKDF